MQHRNSNSRAHMLAVADGLDNLHSGFLRFPLVFCISFCLLHFAWRVGQIACARAGLAGVNGEKVAQTDFSQGCFWTTWGDQTNGFKVLAIFHPY